MELPFVVGAFQLRVAEALPATAATAVGAVGRVGGVPGPVSEIGWLAVEAGPVPTRLAAVTVKLTVGNVGQGVIVVTRTVHVRAPVVRHVSARWFAVANTL